MGTLCSQSLCAGNALLQRRSEFTWIIAFALKAALLCWHPPPLFTDTRWQWLWCSPPRCLGKRGRLVRARAYVVCRGEPFSRREDEHKQKLSLEPKPPGGPNVLHFPGRPPMGASRFPPEKPQSHPAEVKCTFPSSFLLYHLSSTSIPSSTSSKKWNSSVFLLSSFFLPSRLSSWNSIFPYCFLLYSLFFFLYLFASCSLPSLEKSALHVLFSIWWWKHLLALFGVISTLTL